ncbi:hypothetical protein HKD37_14G040698 [Glycine soja]
MAPKKLLSKRARKDAAGEGSSVAPQADIEFDGHRFRSEEHQHCFEAIKGWSFLKERRVQLREGEYTKFHEEVAWWVHPLGCSKRTREGTSLVDLCLKKDFYKVEKKSQGLQVAWGLDVGMGCCRTSIKTLVLARRQWTQLIGPMAKYDPEVVMEFYANAWPTEEGVRDKCSWVWGQWVPYDEDAINQFLGHPLVLEEEQDYEFSERRVQASGFDQEAIGQLLTFDPTVARRQWTQLIGPMAKYDPEVVMEFYANAWPTEEGVRDKCSWVWGQWVPYDEDAINQFLGHPLVLEEEQDCEFSERRVQASGFDQEAIGQLLNILPAIIILIFPCQNLISDTIYQFVGITPPRHPVDPEKSNKALGFPPLITGLCQFYGVSVTPTKPIRPPINRSFIEKYCMPRQAQQPGQDQQQQLAADAPLPPLQQPLSLESISSHI